MANHRLTVGNRVLPVANSCCLCCCKCFAATMTTIGLIALAAGIAFFIIFRNSDDDFEIFEYEDVKQKVPIYAIATVLVIVGSVFFVVSLCMWCCVCCMTPKSQPGVVLVQPTRCFDQVRKARGGIGAWRGVNPNVGVPPHTLGIYNGRPFKPLRRFSNQPRTWLIPRPSWRRLLHHLHRCRPSNHLRALQHRRPTRRRTCDQTLLTPPTCFN
uniref:Uncharacterized protein n=1 Tax=Schistocephalus solidus TaxID=70667 RepID=A0A0X3NIS6_SCHSO